MQEHPLFRIYLTLAKFGANTYTTGVKEGYLGVNLPFWQPLLHTS
jgi:hypothetical protein